MAHQSRQLRLLRRHHRRLEEINDADDAVQRRPNLVAHVGEEGRLRPVGLLCRDARDCSIRFRSVETYSGKDH